MHSPGPSRRKAGVLAALAAGLLVATAGPARAEEFLLPERLEWGLLPIIAGSTDAGFIFGATMRFSQYEDGREPYRWSCLAQAMVSVAGGPDGPRFPVHDDLVRFDLPQLAGGAMRLWVDLAFMRSIDAGYWGVGNASGEATRAFDPAGTPRDPGSHRFQYVRTEPTFRLRTRIAIAKNLHVSAGLKLAYVLPGVYAGSRLAEDAAPRTPGGAATVTGTDPHASLQLAVGLAYDSRDDETIPTSGMFIEALLRASPGMGTDLHHGGASVNARFFAPLAGRYLVLAFRVLADVIFGNPPFYELARAGAINFMDYPGSGDGIRGVPMGRYHGKIKAGANLELRSMFLPFHIDEWRFLFGAAAFADAGRVWADWRSDPAVDGSGAQLKFGTGGGLRLLWGSAVLVRLDVAWSPDAGQSALGIPVGLYLQLDEAF